MNQIDNTKSPKQQWETLLKWMEKNHKTATHIATLLTKATGRRIQTKSVESWIRREQQPRAHIFPALYLLTHGIVDANSFYDMSKTKPDKTTTTVKPPPPMYPQSEEEQDDGWR